MLEIVDLSQEIFPGMPVFPGLPEVRITLHASQWDVGVGRDEQLGQLRRLLEEFEARPVGLARRATPAI